MKEPSDLLRRTWKENWAIYILKGMAAKLYMIKPVVPVATHNHLRNAIDDALITIKFQQQTRKEKRK